VGKSPEPRRSPAVKTPAQIPAQIPAKTPVKTAAVFDDGTEVVSRRITLTTLMVIVAVAAILQLGQEVFLPLAMAVLLTFALSPVVSFLRNRGLRHFTSVLLAVFVAFVVIGLFVLTTVFQIGLLAQDLPSFQANILQKLNAITESGDGSGLIARLGQMLSSINAEISNAVPASGPALPAATEAAPLPVEVIERQNVVQMLSGLILPLISPIATAGLVIVVVIFMLLEREEIRDRFIRLVGARDLHQTTQMLEEAGGRVAKYLLIQLLVNSIYAVAIGLGLWFIGVPNALLWGLVTLVMRFVPFIGSFLAAAFPLFLAFAVAPGWSAVLWTAALFLVVELITSNVIEPWLYGSRIGVSPLAIIVCAVFWTWIWGPLGLVLSTPLTVCLVVLGRHLPQFEVFDILFGDEPALAPHSRLYQRLLAGDPIESTFRAEEALEEMFLADYYAGTGIPALLLGQHDFERGVLTAAQEDRLAQAAAQMVADLAPVVAEERAQAAAEAGAAGPAPPDATAAPEGGLPGTGFRILCIGGRRKLDDVAAAMLAQAMEAEGAEATALSYMDLIASRFAEVAATDAHCVILNFLDAAPSRASLLHVRRIKQAAPRLRVGLVIWQMPEALIDPEVPSQRLIVRLSAEKTAEALEIGGDFVATTLAEAMAAAFQDLPPRPLPAALQKARPRPPKPQLRPVG
jgi:predicted PurR-regulated permease PerM